MIDRKAMKVTQLALRFVPRLAPPKIDRRGNERYFLLRHKFRFMEMCETRLAFV